MLLLGVPSAELDIFGRLVPPPGTGEGGKGGQWGGAGGEMVSLESS